ncbi:hypothetical protein [Actinotalea subterranea]|uniref:hypothetical protein n=1 Tax=Actinotalea subterranea TaxID=2607497 RepID=UPI0011EED72D|nr:hypothetical protein [Actinotalea subterranea]
MTSALGSGLDAAGWTASVVVASDEPELREGVDPGDVSPGVPGFLVIFLVVLACIPLFRSMTSKLRRLDHRARVEAAGEPVTAPADDAAAPGADPDAPGAPRP